MRAFVVRPTHTPPFPGMLLFQEALGVNAQIRGVAERWAREGFFVIAPELFHRVAPGYEATTLDMNVIMPMIKTLTIDGMVADIRAAYDWLARQTVVDGHDIVALGFCMGVARRISPTASCRSPRRCRTTARASPIDWTTPRTSRARSSSTSVAATRSS